MRLRLKTLLIISLCMVSGQLWSAQTQQDPVSLVRNTSNRVFTEVAANLDKYTKDTPALCDLVRSDLIPIIDLPYTARLILGRAGRGIKQEKIDEFTHVLTEMLVNRYAKGLLYFKSKQQLMVLPQRGDLNDKLTKVRSRVRLPSGRDAPVDYAFHKTADGWKAFDLIVEGISYVTTYRNQIMPEVQANGIDSVIARLSSGELNLKDSNKP